MSGSWTVKGSSNAKESKPQNTRGKGGGRGASKQDASQSPRQSSSSSSSSARGRGRGSGAQRGTALISRNNTNSNNFSTQNTTAWTQNLQQNYSNVSALETNSVNGQQQHVTTQKTISDNNNLNNSNTIVGDSQPTIQNSPKLAWGNTNTSNIKALESKSNLDPKVETAASMTVSDLLDSDLKELTITTPKAEVSVASSSLSLTQEFPAKPKQRFSLGRTTTFFTNHFLIPFLTASNEFDSKIRQYDVKIVDKKSQRPVESTPLGL